MPHPVPKKVDIEVPLKTVLPILREMLEYCAMRAVEEVDGIYYDQDRQTVTYYLALTNDDRELFDTLLGVEEVWVIEKVPSPKRLN